MRTHPQHIPSPQDRGAGIGLGQPAVHVDAIGGTQVPQLHPPAVRCGLEPGVSAAHVGFRKTHSAFRATAELQPARGQGDHLAQGLADVADENPFANRQRPGGIG